MISAPQKNSKPTILNSWRNDLLAAISVSLVALPLGLGIGLATGLPPMSGVISAIVGGIVATVFRGSHVAINGPSAGIIAVILSAYPLLDDGSGNIFSYIFAAIVMSGALQVLLGLIRLGRIAEALPSSAINAILASIGVIIIAKQLNYAFGIDVSGNNTVDLLINGFSNIFSANPVISLITITGILLMIFHNKISYKLFHFIPTPVWVLLISIPFVYGFNFFETHNYYFLGNEYELGPQFLLNIPTDPLDSIVFPNFSLIGTFNFWLVVISINLISSVEHLVATKAVDKLDPLKRETPINKDLIGVGISTMVSGFIGGLPVITVILRSSVNVQNNAKTKGSNFYHGLILILLVFGLTNLLQKVPFAALAAILLFTGYRLASPKAFKEIYNKGLEQLLIFMGTLIITLYTDMLWGLAGGLILTLMVHLLLSRQPLNGFFRSIVGSNFEVELNEKFEQILRISGIANFLNIFRLKGGLDKAKSGVDLVIDLTGTKLVDLTVMEILDDYKLAQSEYGAVVSIVGLEKHVTSSENFISLHSKITDISQELNPRSQRLKTISEEYGWTFQVQTDWYNSYLKNFYFFSKRPIEKKANVISGIYEQHNAVWELSDITFDEGALIAKEVFQTTVQVIYLPFNVPSFIIEKEEFLDRVFEPIKAFSGRKDIDFKEYPNFSKKFVLTGDDEEEIRDFFNSRLLRFLADNDIYHIECNGEALLIFRYFKPAKTEEIFSMLEFADKLLKEMK